MIKDNLLKTNLLKTKIICCKETEVFASTTILKTTNCGCVEYHYYVSSQENNNEIFSIIYKKHFIYYNIDTYEICISHISFYYNQNILDLNDIISKYNKLLNIQ